MSADNPASSLLGGFKQSASAFRFCSHCLGSEEDVQSKVQTHTYIHEHVNKCMNICIHMYTMYNAPVQMYVIAVSQVVLIHVHVCILNYFHMQFIESQFELRSDAKHSHHCDVWSELICRQLIYSTSLRFMG